MTRKQKGLSIGLAAVLLLSVIAVTYAYFTSSVTKDTTAVTVETSQLANLTMTNIKSDATPPIYPGWVGYQAIEVAASGSGSTIYDLTLNISGGTNIKNDVTIEVCKIEDTQVALKEIEELFFKKIKSYDVDINDESMLAKFDVKLMNFYYVDDKFPRIKESDIRFEEMCNIEYSLIVNALNKYLED